MGAMVRCLHSRAHLRTGIAAANVEVEGTDVAATSRPQSFRRTRARSHRGLFHVPACNIDSCKRRPPRTIHELLSLDGELHSKLDFSKLDDDKVAFLMLLEVLLLDEARGLRFSLHAHCRSLYRMRVLDRRRLTCATGQHD